MSSSSCHHPETSIDGYKTKKNPEAYSNQQQLPSHPADDWTEDRHQAPVKRFHSFASIRSHLGHRKKVLQQEREQRELMEDDSSSSSSDGEEQGEATQHELGKPFLSSFTRNHLRNIRNKWKLEEGETIVFQNDENAAPDSGNKVVEASSSSNSKRSKKKREKQKWMSRVKNRALTLAGKPSSTRPTSGSNKKKKKKTRGVGGSKVKAESSKPTSPSSLPLSLSFQQRMAMRFEQRAQHERSSHQQLQRQEDSAVKATKKPEREEDEKEEHYDISSAARVAVGVEDELLHEINNDLVPSLVYPKGMIQPNNKERVLTIAPYTPYCYSSDDDSSRREKSRQQQQQPPFKDKTSMGVRVVGLAATTPRSFQGDYYFSEDSSLGSIPSVIMRLDDSSRHSRDNDSGFAGLMSQKGSSSSALDQSFDEKGKIRIGRTIVGVLEASSDGDAQSTTSSIEESSMGSIPSLLKESSTLPCDILRIDGVNNNDDENQDDESVDLVSALEEKVETTDLSQEAENAKDDINHLGVSFESSIPSPTTLKLQSQAHHYQPEHCCDNDSLLSSPTEVEETDLDARQLREQMEEAASPPPSPIQPTVLEVPSYNDNNDAHQEDIDDIPVEENTKHSMFRKLLSCGSGIKTMIPTSGKAFKAKADSIIRKSKTKSYSMNQNAPSGVPTNFSFVSTTSPSGMTYTSSQPVTTPSSGFQSLASAEYSPYYCADENTNKSSYSAIHTPVKKMSSGVPAQGGVHSKSSRAVPSMTMMQSEHQDPFQTPPKSSNKTKKPFDYRRRTPAKETHHHETKSTSSSSRSKSSPVSLILDSFERLTNKKKKKTNHPQSSQCNQSTPRRQRTRRLKKIMSKFQGKKVPMLIALGLAALCQSVLNNLDISNALVMVCAGSCHYSTPLVLLHWDGGFDAAVGGMSAFAQAMIAHG